MAWLSASIDERLKDSDFSIETKDVGSHIDVAIRIDRLKYNKEPIEVFHDAHLTELAAQKDVYLTISGEYHPRKAVVFGLFSLLLKHPNIYTRFENKHDERILRETQLLSHLEYAPEKGYHVLKRCA